MSKHTFYKNILFESGHNSKKRINIYTIDKFIEVQDIKKELVSTSSDFSIELSIQKKKEYILNQLDNV